MFEKELQTAIRAAYAAGEIILEGYTHKNKIDIKENQSQVTEVDKKSEEAIIKILEEESGYEILSEETRNEVSGSDYWAVDPLDGTTNFIRRIPIFSVSIALIIKGEPVVGVVFNPYTKELYTASKGSGAYCNDEKISVSDEESVIFANSGYGEEHRVKFSKIVYEGRKYYIRKLGSTAYELAIIAKGGGDGFAAWGDKLWDHAAGILLVRDAGGIVTDWNGNDWETDEDHVLASNQKIYSPLLVIVKNL